MTGHWSHEVLVIAKNVVNPAMISRRTEEPRAVILKNESNLQLDEACWPDMVYLCC